MKQSFWQFTKADGNPDWPTGADNFEHMWDRGWDLLRFHKGEKFTIENRATHTVGPEVKLVEVPDRLKKQLQDNPDTVFIVRSRKDNFALAFRRHTEELVTLGEKFLDIGRSYLGAPYVWGGSAHSGLDCSGLVIAESSPFGITYAEHKAYVMWQEFKQNANGKFVIPRAQLIKGDLLIIHGGDHIATYVDDRDGGRVLDAEPDPCQSPWGWTPAGVQIRSMAQNYYCAWENVNAVCRLSKINGMPK